MNDNFMSEQLKEILKSYAIFSINQSHPNEGKLLKLTDKLRDLIVEMKSTPPELRAEAQQLMTIIVAKEFCII